MKTLAIIPARMGSSRFPGKPMANIFGIPMIEHVYRRAKMSSQLSEVYVATCDKVIYDHILSIGGKSVMTKDTHERCTERTAEAVMKIEENSKVNYDVVLMLQGDEPMVTTNMIDISLAALREDSTVQVVNLMTELSLEDQKSPNEIKVVTDKFKNALYFSRSPIPSFTRGTNGFVPMKQVCVIPFRKQFLFDYISWEPSPLEIVESVDMNRVLENGFKIRMVYCEEKSYAVDAPSDIQKVEQAFKNDPMLKSYARN